MPMQFLTIDNISISLNKEIKYLEDASANFRKCWLTSDTHTALKESENAMSIMHNIAITLLRYRDGSKATDSFKSALRENIGEMIETISPENKKIFLSAADGEGCFPEINSKKNLKLSDALNKIKHAELHGLKFNLSNNKHTLYYYTNFSTGKPSSISKFNIEDFCHACTNAVSRI